MTKQLSAFVDNISPSAGRAGYFLRLACLPSDAGTFLLPVCPPKEWKGAFFRKSGIQQCSKRKGWVPHVGFAPLPQLLDGIRLQQSGFNDTGIIHKLIQTIQNQRMHSHIDLTFTVSCSDMTVGISSMQSIRPCISCMK